MCVMVAFQASWQQLRSLYPILGAAQLRHLLDNYDLNGRQVPSQWCPPSEEVHKIMEEGMSTTILPLSCVHN